jgi:Mg-chelatase subunit ChlD
MKTNYTHISVILDRSGSMETIREDTIGGFNAFLKDQQGEPGAATLTLVQFDDQDPYEVVHHFKPIDEVPALSRKTYVPRGATPLLDAMGRGMNDVEKSIADMDKGDRPARLVMAFITDGMENSSREFQKDQVTKMIEERTEKDGWQFVFLSADLGAIDEAVNMGIDADSAMPYAKSATGSARAWRALSRGTSRYRSGRTKKLGFQPPDDKSSDGPEQA